MDATIVVGVVGVAATAITAWIGSWNTRKATERTVEAGSDANRATLAAAREDRLYDKRCAVYEETLTAMNYQQYKLNMLLAQGKLEDAPSQELEGVIHSYGSPDWAATQGRLTAYASDAVWEASKAAEMARESVPGRYYNVLDMRKHLDLVPDTPDAHERGMLALSVQALNGAFKGAAQADKALIQLIRDELRSEPEAVMSLSATTPRRSTAFWRRQLS